MLKDIDMFSEGKQNKILVSYCGMIKGCIEHSENRFKQAYEDISIIEDKNSSFEQRKKAIESLENHLLTVKSDMERAELYL